MTGSRCHTTGKLQYISRKAARRGRTSTPSRRDEGAMGIYRCDHCGYYHLGHKPLDVQQGKWDKAKWLEWKRAKGEGS